ncbi:MAG TPA: helix-turn-helix domain-containing protein [Solirubrobacteraceae bacterium]|nr:helix-turn-helix domain-containing protein [Solirubrobacteraceae bacterium]
MPTTSSPPSRRRRLPRAEREAAMLRAAGDLFAARGFHAASMDEIAEAAGISKPMLYNYFGSKEGLYAAYVRSSAQALIQRMREAASPSAPAQERLRAGLLAFLTYAEQHRAGWAVLHNEATAQSDPLATEVMNLRERLTGMLNRIFDDDGFAHAFAGATESLVSWWLAHPEHPKDLAVGLLMNIAESKRAADT